MGQPFIKQAQFATPHEKQLDVAAELSGALYEMKPKEAIERMLVTKITSLHNQMMHNMRQYLEKVRKRFADMQPNSHIFGDPG